MSVVKVTIAYFARARECTGVSEEELELTQPVSLEQLFLKVLTIHPGLAEIKQMLTILLNGKWQSGDAALKDGDRVALLPPVGGG